MEDALVRLFVGELIRLEKVLILVVMEDALVPSLASASSSNMRKS